MKIAKFFAGIFGAIGTVLLVGSIGLCLFSLNTPVRTGEVPTGAVACAEVLEDALSRRDYDAMEARIYGQPELGLSGAPEEELARMVWDIVQLNLNVSWQGDVCMQDTTLYRDAVVTYMDVASITDNLPARAHALLTQRVEEATDMNQLYDEGGQFREDLLDQVMKAALTQAIMEDAKTTSASVRVEFIHRDGQWWAVPDTALLTALSGGVA